MRATARGAATPACAATSTGKRPTYSDRRSLLYLPAGYDPQRPSLIVLYLHGQGATLERDVISAPGRAAADRRIGPERGAGGAAARRSMPPNSSAGNFWRPGHFAAYIDEAAERLMRLYGDRRAGAHFNQAPVVVVAYSGGYLSAAYALRARRRRPSHQGRDPDGCALWRRGQVRGLGRGAPPPGVPAERLHRIHARTRTRRCRACWTSGACPTSRACRRRSVPGNDRLRAVRRLDMHGDFVTRAWRPDPLKHALAMIPGYARGSC